MYYELPDYSGPFMDVIPEYVTYMRGLGYDYGKPILFRLREIDLFFKAHGVCRVEITEELFEQWSKKRGNECEKNQRSRTNILIAFSKYLALKGFEGIYIGETSCITRESCFIPYIFSKEQISALMRVLKCRIKENPCDCETAAFAVIISLYYGCGLRKTEALKLKLGDIDLSAGTIRIMDSKNHTSRLIVASESILRQLLKYCDLFCGNCDKTAYLFRNENGAMFSESKLYSKYKCALTDAGIKPRESGRLPRIHDMRHTFCVHTLESMTAKGFDLYASLPLLVTYLGHKCISETEYYLRLVEQNFKTVTDASREYAPELFPKARCSYDE